ncbi:MAG: isochorismate synthase [Thermomicrobiales bacterium]
MIATLSIERPAASDRAAIEDALTRARRLGRPALCTRVERLPLKPDPLAFLAASSRALGGGILWEQPAAGLAFSGAGSAFALQADGPGRFGEISSSLRNLSEFLVRDDAGARFPIVGGFSFGVGEARSQLWSNFPDARLVVPRVLLQIDGNDALVRVTLHVGPESSAAEVDGAMRYLFDQAQKWAEWPLDGAPCGTEVFTESHPHHGAWELEVATAVSLIRQNMLDKVVLAREERLHAMGAISPVSTLARLRILDADTTLFAMQSDRDWFIGATPERLVRLEDGRVDVTCLAGSIGVGRSLQEQALLAARLLDSAKDREEHEIVVRSTMRALEEMCEDVTRLSGTPRVVAARTVQHLETPISARLCSAGQILDLVERLHPTPAVGGYPRDIALTVIRELEEIDRGWYAGPFGWTTPDGSGEFAVAIRSALLSGRTASLFAGCGIMADSDPAAEYEETRLKLRPMLTALGAA